MTARIDYYTFMISPWAYLGSARLEAIAARHKAELRIIPMEAAGVFPVSGGLPLAQRAKQRQAYRLVELARWRDYLGVPINFQPKHFPAPDGLAARMVIAARDGGQDAIKLAHAIMRGAWAEERNVADADTLKQIAAETGLDGAALLALAEAPEAKAALTAGTEQAIAAQVFGAPSYVFDGEIFWGQDRLDFLDRALARKGGSLP